jgi:hypothetical protein
MDKIEYHTDGSPWIACSKNSPKFGRTFEIGKIICQVYHPKAKEIDDSNYGSDSLMECSFCKKRWWIERDG